MRTLLFTIFVLTFFACTSRTNKSATKLSGQDSLLAIEHFDTALNYIDSACLLYNGKSLFIIGQNVKQLDTTLSFRPDPNGRHERNRYFIIDYLSLDNYYSIDLTTGSLAGAIYFSADNKGRIFSFNASWRINAELVDTSGMEIMNFLHEKYFPCLPTDFKGRQSFEVKHRYFKENFKLYPVQDNVDKEHGFNPHWSFDYYITLTDKKGL
jgi:hypothetical protein